MCNIANGNYYFFNQYFPMKGTKYTMRPVKEEAELEELL